MCVRKPIEDSNNLDYSFVAFFHLSLPLVLASLPSSKDYERDQLEQNWAEPGVLTNHQGLIFKKCGLLGKSKGS